MNLINEIVNRLMNTLGYATKKELANALNISASDLNNRQKSGSLKKLLIDHAIHNNVNVDWLLTGRGQANKKDNIIAEPQQPYQAASLRRVTDTAPRNLGDILQKTAYILESDTPHKIAFIHIIDACYRAVKSEERIDEQELKIKEMEDKITALAGALPPAVSE